MSRMNNFAVISDGRFKIYHTDRHWWDLPYIIAAPDGSVITVAASLRGAKRALRKARKDWDPERKWWNSPIVYAESRDEGGAS